MRWRLISKLPSRNAASSCSVRPLPFEWFSEVNDIPPDSFYLPSLRRLNSLHTFKDRHKDTLPEILKLISSSFTLDQRLSVCDLAASNGITSVPFFEGLKEYKDLHFVSSDYNAVLRVVQIGKGSWRILAGPDGQWLQAHNGKYLLSNKTKGEPIWNRIMSLWLSRWYGWNNKNLIIGAKTIKEFSLAHPQLRNLAKDDPRIEYTAIDFFKLPEQRFDVIRLMTRMTFERSPEVGRSLFVSLKNALSEGGLLFYGRGRAQSSECIVFRKLKDQLEYVGELSKAAKGSNKLLEIVRNYDFDFKSSAAQSERLVGGAN